MPKISVTRMLLYEKWSLTIQSIALSVDPKKELLFYLKSNKNVYTERILCFLDRKRKKIGYYEKHHIFPKSIGGLDKDWNIIHVTQTEHSELHKLRFLVYGEYVDKLALSLLSQSFESRKKNQILGSRAAVMLKKCGFQNKEIQQKAAQKGRKSMTNKKKKGYFSRSSKEIQNHLKKDHVWFYQEKQKSVAIQIKAFSCLTLVDLVQKLENTGLSVGKVESKITSKTSGLARVIKGQRKHYGGWSLSTKKIK